MPEPLHHESPPLPSSLPVLPLRRAVMFPMTVQPLAVNRAFSVEAVNRALAADRLVLLLMQEGTADEPRDDELRRVGTVGVIRQMAKGEDGLRILVEGIARVRVTGIEREGTLIRAQIVPAPEPIDRSIEVEARLRQVRELVDRALSLATGLSPELRPLVMSIEDPLRLVYLLASMLDMKPEDRQLLLEQDDLAVKLTAVSGALQREIALLELKGKIESQAQQEMTDAQRQYYLRQQLKAIQQELGEAEGEEIQNLRKRIEDAHLPEAVATVLDREVRRLEKMSQASPEHQMLRTYIDWVLDVPWSKITDDRIELAEARRVLDEDHYDLDRVKERIIEYLAVRKLKNDTKGPILCFVGPPGVGKTSLGQSIARAMNRKFVRISLGGVRDEAEIRGHRRTYIGSMPGRIVQALRQAGTMNPVFMLDEIDKVSVGFQGDPAAALLEVLDPAQNHSFRDHYLEINVDLSRVLFIATANQLGPVHPALLDRMEIIQLSGYSEEEKLHIARRYLLPRQLSENGLPPGSVELTDAALRRVISEYTREAGVRNLERQLGTIARKIAARLVGAPIEVSGGGESGGSTAPVPVAVREGGAPAEPTGGRPGADVPDAGGTSAPAEVDEGPGAEGNEGAAGTESPPPAASLPAFERQEVDAPQIPDYLGPPRFKPEVAFRTSRPGVATGVAWTETGGDVLFIEASLLPGGKGNLILTGQLGNVMQESARAAVSHIRANAEALGVDPAFMDQHDLHVHVPAGAIPKDGPSAGVTIATAILSAIRREPIRDDLAMTGEITLSGLVLPVGGIREKALAARRFGVHNFILPADNENDLTELPAEVKKDLTFIPVRTLEEVLKVALPVPAAS